MADEIETGFKFEKGRASARLGGLLELAQPVHEAPHTVRPAVEICRAAKPDAHCHRVVASDPPHVVEVEDLACLLVLLEGRLAQLVDRTFDGLP